MSEQAEEVPPLVGDDEPTGPEQRDLTRLFDQFSPFPIRSMAITGLLVLAILYTLYLAQDILMPFAAAIVLSFVVAPVHRGLGRLRLPDAVSAIVIVATLVGSVLVGVYYLSGPVASWFERVPEITEKLQETIRPLRGPIEQVRRASEEVERATDVREPEPGPEPQLEAQPQPPPQHVVVAEGPSLLQRLATGIWSFLANIGLILLLLFFLLASGDLFKLKLVRVLPTMTDKKRAVAILSEIEHNVSTYLFTVTLINIGLGCAIAAALYAIGLPNAVLWGVMATFLNFIPYVGSFTGMIVVGVVAFVSFDELWLALLVPLVYITLSGLEGNFLTPSLLGRSLTLNPVVIVANLVIWGWLWGVPGALLAGPFLVIVKVFCDRIEPLGAIGEFLSAR